jgi:ring-1,2-phenylacetyl-CoA epoxidase subunit PaaC
MRSRAVPVADADRELTDGTRAAVRDLILVLADSKRLLGTRYADWILGAPELETGIACASMAQDEWGHGRLLYAMLKDFDEDVDRLEHGREPGEYRSIEVLDAPPAGWADLVALNALVDAALSVQFEAMRESSYAPMRQRVEKMLDEEHFHAAHGNAWLRRMASGGDDSRSAMALAVRHIAPALLRWFGPDSERARALVEEGVMDAAGDALRARFAERLAPLLGEIGEAGLLDEEAPDFDGFDEHTRRSAGGDGPDAATIRRVRGDRNRAFLMY